MITILINTLAVAGTFATLLGVLVLFHLMKPNKLPADKSNRINSIRLFWFALTKPHLFVDSFWWLSQDEEDNMRRNNNDS
jgi:hypothetical protein